MRKTIATFGLLTLLAACGSPAPSSDPTGPTAEHDAGADATGNAPDATGSDGGATLPETGPDGAVEAGTVLEAGAREAEAGIPSPMPEAGKETGPTHEDGGTMAETSTPEPDAGPGNVDAGTGNENVCTPARPDMGCDAANRDDAVIRSTFTRPQDFYLCTMPGTSVACATFPETFNGSTITLTLGVICDASGQWRLHGFSAYPGAWQSLGPTCKPCTGSPMICKAP